MIVYEFYLKDEFKTQPFEVLCGTFYRMGVVLRKVDGTRDTAVYAISRNPRTKWVQLLVDDYTPVVIYTAIESVISKMCDSDGFIKYNFPIDNIAPMERPREVIFGRGT